MANCEYVGVDPNPKYIEYCRLHANGRFEQMSGERLTFPNQYFDMALSFSVGHHVPDDRLLQIFGEARRVLKDDGVFLFADVVRPIVRWRHAALLLEWLDEGNSFRTEADYLALLASFFVVEHRQEIVDQFYRTVVMRCRKA